jgi:hypothetical protein
VAATIGRSWQRRSSRRYRQRCDRIAASRASRTQPTTCTKIRQAFTRTPSISETNSKPKTSSEKRSIWCDRHTDGLAVPNRNRDHYAGWDKVMKQICGAMWLTQLVLPNMMRAGSWRHRQHFIAGRKERLCRCAVILCFEIWPARLCRGGSR